MKKTVVGVFGGSAVPTNVTTAAEVLGGDIARNGWITLTGGAAAGVMEAALKGAASAGGETIGILEGKRNTAYSSYVTIPVFTNAGLARDYINVLTSDVAVFIGPVTGGTLIEVAYALKTETPIVLLSVDAETAALIEARSSMPIPHVDTPEGTIGAIRDVLAL